MPTGNMPFWNLFEQHQRDSSGLPGAQPRIKIIWKKLEIYWEMTKTQSQIPIGLREDVKEIWTNKIVR